MGKRITITSRRRSISETLLGTTLEHASYQKVRLSELEHQDFPFADCKQLVTILLDIHSVIIDELDSLLTEIRKNPNDKEIQRDAEIGARRFGHLLAFLHSSLELLEFSGRSHISQGSVYLLGGLTSHFGRTERFILVPSYEFNYSYTDVLHHIIKATEDAIPAMQRKLGKDVNRIAVLSYPNVYRENVLSNCLLGHEVGHYVVEQAGLVRDLVAQIQLNSNLLQKVVDDYRRGRIGQTAISDFFATESVKAGIMQETSQTLTSWITELASDVFGFRTLGPVCLFALSKFLLALHNLDESTDDHPSARIRLSLLLDQFEKKGFANELKGVNDKDKKVANSILDYFDRLKVFISYPPGAPITPKNELLSDAITKLQDAITIAIDNTIDSNKYGFC